MHRVNGTSVRWWSKIKRIVPCICGVLAPFLGAEAQEISFGRVTIPARTGELVGTFHSSLAAGDRRVVQVEFRNLNGTPTRYAFVGIKGTESEELFDPYRDAQTPYATDVKPLAYRDKVVVSIRNVGPGGVDSIWVTDGTAAGTREIAQVDPGADPFIISDTLVLITEDTEVNFLDLHSGVVTRLAEPTPSVMGYAYLGELADGRGMFAAGFSVYISDGTVAGTETLLTHSDPLYFSDFSFRSAEKSDPSPYRVFGLNLNESLYDTQGTIFVTDGTVAGTREIPRAAFQFQAGADKPDESPFGAQLGNSLIYTNTTVDKGRELWSLNLETLEASLLKDTNPGPAYGFGNNGTAARVTFYVVNRKLYFVADNGVHGEELWVSDGTAAGTVLVKDIAPGTPSGVSRQFYQYPHHPSVGRYFIFGANPNAQESYPNGETYPRALWASDGTPEGTFQLAKSIPYGWGTTELSDEGVLVFASPENFGIDAGAGFLRFFDPTLGQRTSASLITVKGASQRLGDASRLSRVGEHYYVEFIEPGGLSSVMIAAPRKLCPGSDSKPIPGQCGCGVGELPADSSGRVVQPGEESDGSTICMTPIGPIYIPATLKGTIGGKLTQRAGQASSIQLTIPASFKNALKMTTTAAGMISASAARNLKVQHGVGLMLIDSRKRSIKHFPLRKTSTGTLKVRLGRRLTAHQQLTFLYAVGATKGGRQLVQTPYKKSGSITLRKARR